MVIVLSVHQNIVARIASGSNEVFLLFRWGIRVEQGERVAVGFRKTRLCRSFERVR